MSSPMSQQENKDVTSITAGEAVGCRACSCVIALRYIVFALMIVGGIVVIVATPRECPSGYSDGCPAYGNCAGYDCCNYDTATCTNERPTVGAIVGGIIMIVVAAILACISCCHQARCILSNTYYDDKILFCC